MKDLFKLHDTIGFYIGFTARTMKSAMTRLFQEHGHNVTSEMWPILMMLWYKDGLSQQDIIYALGKEKTTVTRLITGLEKRNLIIRIQDKTNRRNNIIHLTHTGKALRKELVPVAENLQKKALIGLSENEVETLKSLLKKVQRNIST